MKVSLVAMLIFTVFVAGITMAYKSAQSLQFIKPGSSISLSDFGISNSSFSGQGTWRYAIASDNWQQEKTNESLGSSRVFAFVRDPNNTQNVYAATSTGLYFYEGSNDSWASLAGGMPSDTQVLSVSTNARDASYLFVATLQNDGTSKIWRSQNAGKTFLQVYQTSGPTEKIIDVANDWYNPQRVFALSDQGTFLRSDDEGLSWRVANKLNRPNFTHLVMDPNDSRILYALQPNVGMLQSTDSGATWKNDKDAFAPFPSSAKIINMLRPVAGVPGCLYCATNYGILRSENGGKSFTVMHSLVAKNSVPIQAIDLGKDAQTLFMAAGNTIYESRDEGKSWEAHVIPGTQTITSLIYLALPSEKIFTGTY